MKKRTRIKYKTNGGAAMMILVIFFVFISLAILISITTPVVREFKIANDNLHSKQAYFLSESGVEDALYRIKNGKKIDASENIVLGSSTATTSITTLSNNQKEITSLGDTNSNERTVNVKVSTGTGVSFNYGIEVGLGGIYLSNSGTVNGSVYANGPIKGDGSGIITGTAISADSPAIIADQSNGSGNPQYDLTFAKSYYSQDIAQSFKISTSSPLNKVQFFIKKKKRPSNVTVKIVDDSNGNPSTNILAKGYLSASSVTHSYGWVDVSFQTNPVLTVGKTYWLVIDSGRNSYRNYYQVGASSDNYTNGVAKIGRLGRNWNNTSPSNLDLFFKIYLGGFNGLIEGTSESKWNPFHVGTISGSAQAHTIKYTNATNGIYCQDGTGNNSPCIIQPDPTYITPPISDGNITAWKNDAASGGTYNGNYYVGWAGATLGPKKINGNLTIRGGGTLVLTGNLWVTGNITLNGGGNIKLDPSFGTGDGIIVSDKNINISGGGHATGSGATGSYLMMLSTSYSNNAVSVSGGAGAVIISAPKGTVKITGGASLKEVNGYKIVVSGGSSITYESGLTNNNFSSGPSGSWNISDWQEVK